MGALADGAIIESNENANGYYVKWSDGTMICTSPEKILPTAPINSDFSLSVLYPASFSRVFSSVLQVLGTGSGNLEVVGNLYANGPCLTTTTSSVLLRGYTYKYAISSPVVCKFFTVGRWKA